MLILTIAYIITIALFLTCVVIAVMDWQRRNRSEMRRLEHELDVLVGKLRDTKEELS